MISLFFIALNLSISFTCPFQCGTKVNLPIAQHANEGISGVRLQNPCPCTLNPQSESSLDILVLVGYIPWYPHSILSACFGGQGNVPLSDMLNLIS